MVAPASDARKTTRQILYLGILAWAVSFIIMAVFATYVIIRAQQINTELCQITDENRDLQQKLINVQQAQAISRADSIFERNLIRQEFNELRALIPPLKCSIAGGPRELEP